jgi:hypothetical protein
VSAKPCKRCLVRPAMIYRADGLCWSCGRQREYAEAELDRMIAERRATMPPAPKLERQRPYTIPVYRITKRRVPQRGSLGHGRN